MRHFKHAREWPAQFVERVYERVGLEVLHVHSYNIVHSAIIQGGSDVVPRCDPALRISTLDKRMHAHDANHAELHAPLHSDRLSRER